MLEYRVRPGTRYTGLHQLHDERRALDHFDVIRPYHNAHSGLFQILFALPFVTDHLPNIPVRRHLWIDVFLHTVKLQHDDAAIFRMPDEIDPARLLAGHAAVKRMLQLRRNKPFFDGYSPAERLSSVLAASIRIMQQTKYRPTIHSQTITDGDDLLAGHEPRRNAESNIDSTCSNGYKSAQSTKVLAGLVTRTSPIHTLSRNARSWAIRSANLLT